MIFTLNDRNPKDKLLIFENFRIDETLPRNVKPVVKPTPPTGLGASADSLVNFTQQNSDGVYTLTASSAATSPSFIISGNTVVSSNGMWSAFNQEPIKPSWFARFKAFCTRQKLALMVKLTETKVQYVFDLVLKNAEAMKIFNERMDAHGKLLENAKKAGQVAMVEKLTKEIELRKYENALIASGITKRVTEKQLLEFTAKCHKGLNLDWVKNFTRPIPEELVEIKAKADEAKLFDNYVVLYYDPENRSAEMTEAEKEKAKDPILFGVMRASRNLYFIGDWKDELCDLTLADIVDKLGTKLDIQ